MQLNRTEILNLIEPHLQHYVLEDVYEVKTSASINFLTHSRFDLAFKLLYLDMLDKDVEFSNDFYKEHIRAFSLGSYSEHGNEKKINIECFYSDFNSIYKNISNNGFNISKTLLPVSEKGSIVNGAHRVASAIKLNKDVSYITLDTTEPNYNYEFFYNRNVPTEMLDAAALKFVEYAQDIYIACIWPTAQKNDEEVESIIPNIVYRKNITLNYNGAHNFISQVYLDEYWLGDIKNNFRGAKGKLLECFREKGPVRIVAFQAENLDVVLKVKEDIRRLFDVGKHSIHITDTKEEALNIAKITFNDNSIHFINYAKPNTFIDFHKKLDNIYLFLQNNNIKQDDFLLDGSMVLAAYGLRNANDVDYFVKDNKDIVSLMQGFDPHDNELVFYKKEKNELLYDPTNYFYFQNLKLICFEQLYLMKKNRAEKKDLNDLQIMRALMNDNQLKKKINQVRQSVYYKKIIIRSKSIELLKTTKLFDSIRSIYRFIRGKK